MLRMLGVVGSATFLALSAVLATGIAVATGDAESVEFVCPNDRLGLSAVDVLEATGEHGVFLDYLRTYDAEGYEILTDPALSDKTIWAPTDSAFAALGDAPESASPEEIKAVLGFHITPPRRTVEGDYPIITFDYLAEGGQIVHQTRTGILTGSDQRVRTVVEDGRYSVEGIHLKPVAWCTEAGSVFAIDEVIVDVAAPSWWESALGLAIYYAIFQYPYITVLAGVVLVSGAVVLILRWSRRRRTN